MNFDVFISYPHEDKTTADAACAKLEAEGIRCWIAPRDVPPGAEWAGAIVEAIDRCNVMVLVFSSHSNKSKQVLREVQHAFDGEKPVVPLRIENVIPEKSLLYYMQSVHWLDALTPPLEQHLEKLAVSVQALVRAPISDEHIQKDRIRREAETQQRAEEEQRRKQAEETHRLAEDEEKPRSTLSTDAARTIQDIALREHWLAYLLEGILLMILGATGILGPRLGTDPSYVPWWGWLFLFSGIVGLITTFWLKQAPGFWWSLLSAVLGIVVGVLLIGWWSPFVLWFLVFFVMKGIFLIMFGVEHKRSLSGRGFGWCSTASSTWWSPE